ELDKSAKDNFKNKLLNNDFSNKELDNDMENQFSSKVIIAKIQE
ncbi:15763_t:CDS:2, partial [Gigaspora margarita]